MLNRGGAGRCPRPETAAVRSRRYRWAGFDAGGGLAWGAGARRLAQRPGLGWSGPGEVRGLAQWRRCVAGAPWVGRRRRSIGPRSGCGRCGFRHRCALRAGSPAGLLTWLWGLRRRWSPRNHATIEAGKPTHPTPPTTEQIAHVVALTFNHANQRTSIARIEPPYRPLEQVWRCDLR
ncbi:hypothetical protein NDU88_005454 [Pleurodeles waltl]|uniref:Uncharacterized protein n=1 Tax=Pleurodeles waltl TaxID=8319 RepID=A0AAV7TUB8_PLEWA|nr:hypothetical protein NDU88_005454 [Pleurodeles waltl]